MTQEETKSTTEIPWDDLFDYSYYKKAQVTIETIRYEVKDDSGYYKGRDKDCYSLEC